MKTRDAHTPSSGKTLLNLALVIFITLPATVAGVWGSIIAYTAIFPIDPDTMMPFFPQGIAFVVFLVLGLILGGLVGGFIWAAIAKRFLSREEVYKNASFGVRIPVVSEINKAYLRWLYKDEGKKR